MTTRTPYLNMEASRILVMDSALVLMTHQGFEFQAQALMIISPQSIPRLVASCPDK
jgi:hypothetical protein